MLSRPSAGVRLVCPLRSSASPFGRCVDIAVKVVCVGNSSLALLKGAFSARLAKQRCPVAR